MLILLAIITLSVFAIGISAVIYSRSKKTKAKYKTMFLLAGLVLIGYSVLLFFTLMRAWSGEMPG